MSFKMVFALMGIFAASLGLAVWAEMPHTLSGPLAIGVTMIVTAVAVTVKNHAVKKNKLGMCSRRKA